MTHAKTITGLICGFTLLVSGAAQAATMAAPQPYEAPTPQYTTPTSEPTLKVDMGAPPQLYDGKAIDGPAAGPQPYHAPNASY